VGSHWATTVIPVQVEYGTLTVVLGPDRAERGGAPVRLRVGPGTYRDLWCDEPAASGAEGELELACEDGIALLWQMSEP
jgi:hypothetical protein